MSRIGKMPIAVPAGVTVDIAENNKVTVKGPKGHSREYYLQKWTSKWKVMKSSFQDQTI